MIADPFGSPQRRLRRAQQHIARIKSDIAAFVDTKPYAISVERNASGFDEHKVKLTRDIPEEITDLTFEAAEALRSSLDQVLYPIALAAKIKPDFIHFPVGTSSDDVERTMARTLKDFDSGILALLRSFKPYQGGNDLIWALNRVRRQSAHRVIVPIGTIGGLAGLTGTSRPGPLKIPPLRWDSGKSEMIFAISGPNMRIDYNLRFSFYVAFGEVDGAPYEPLAETLVDMAAEADMIVGAIEAETRRLKLKLV